MQTTKLYKVQEKEVEEWEKRTAVLNSDIKEHNTRAPAPFNDYWKYAKKYEKTVLATCTTSKTHDWRTQDYGFEGLKFGGRMHHRKFRVKENLRCSYDYQGDLYDPYGRKPPAPDPFDMIAKDLGRERHFNLHNINQEHDSFFFKLDEFNVSETKNARRVGVYDKLKPE